MRYSITQKVRITFFIALFFIFAISFLSYLSISQLIETSRQVDQTQTLIFQLGQLHVTVKEAETAQRAYLLTDDQHFLNSYYYWRELSENQQKELSVIIENFPNQQGSFQDLNRLISARFHRLESILNLYQQGKPFSLDVSNQTMNQLREIILLMQKKEEAFLDIRREQVQRYSWQALFFIVLFSLVSMLLMFFAYFRIRRNVRSRQEAERQLAENNQLLEEKVIERTQEISKNEERYRFMAESIPHIVWTADINGEMDYFSQQLAAYTGVPIEEMLGRRWESIIHPDDLENTRETWMKALASGKDTRVEHRLGGQDGVYRWFETRVVPYGKERGEIVKWFGTTTFIDEEVRAKEAAQQQGELLRDITDSLPVLIAFMDKEFRYRFANRTYEKWFRKTPEEILGQQAWEVIGQKGFNRMKPFLELAFSGQKVSSEVEVHYEHLGDRYIKFDFIPRFENNKVIGTYLLITDVSKVKKIENDLRNTILDAEVKNIELKRINSVLDDFVSMAAHDLKSPVSNLKLSLSLFHKLKEDTEKIKVVSHFEGAVKRLDITLAGLLEIVEVQHVKAVKVVYCQFREILDEIIVNFQEKLKEAGGTVVSNFEDGPAIFYIRPYLVSILTNLISNAIKYRSAERPLRVEVFTERDEEGIILVVKDNGIGMDLDKIGSKLFRPFKRFSSQAEGTGVGLHLVKSIIERNGGEIKVESNPGEGTSFTCFLKNIQINEAEL